MQKANLSDAVVQIQRLFGEGTLAGLSDRHLLDRYAFQGDEQAFKALVQRHGPMVLAVCRGVLNDANDADDAFQAAFLLLVRKARSLWIKESIGGWLHRVACRIAFRVKADTARRRQQERRSAELAGGSRPCGTLWDDTQVVVHEEIDRLPQRYREPIVLCYLEHMTYQQAARHLRWSEATTQGRLARARNLLRARLARRGVTLAGATLASVAASQGASAFSSVMFEAAVRSARQVGLGKAAGAKAVSTAAGVLVNQAVRAMMIARLMGIGAALLVVGTLTTVVVTSLPATGRRIEEPTQSPPAPLSSPPTPRRPSDSSGTSTEARPTTRRLPGLTAEQLEAGLRRQNPMKNQTASSPIRRRKTGPTVNLSKDLKPGQRLNRGDSLFSPLGGFRLTMQDDGNLALYAIDDTQLPDDIGDLLRSHRPELMRLYTNPIWSAGTNVAGREAGPGSYCLMGSDGNFVIYDDAGRTCLESGTRGFPGSFLRCQDDGNLVIYAPGLKAIWCSGTDSRALDSDSHATVDEGTGNEVVP